MSRSPAPWGHSYSGVLELGLAEAEHGIRWITTLSGGKTLVHVPVRARGLLAQALDAVLALKCNTYERYINPVKYLSFLTLLFQQPPLSSQPAEQAIASTITPVMIGSLVSLFLLLPCFIYAAVVPFSLDGKIEG